MAVQLLFSSKRAAHLGHAGTSLNDLICRDRRYHDLLSAHQRSEIRWVQDDADDGNGCDICLEARDDPASSRSCMLVARFSIIHHIIRLTRIKLPMTEVRTDCN